MTIRFYAIAPADAPPFDSARFPGVSMRLWRPAADGLPRGPMRWRNLCWWAMDRLGLLADRRFTEITLSRGERLLHRLVLTPRWCRFPFMADGDLQIGDLWTAPEAQRRGLARAAIGEAVRRAAGDAGKLWYVVDAANVASVRLIESCGFALVGAGRRTQPFGVALAGRFELTEPRRG